MFSIGLIEVLPEGYPLGTNEKKPQIGYFREIAPK
jgi:hypothetical protein